MGQSIEDSHKYDFDWAIGWNRLGLDLIGLWPRKHVQKDTIVRQLRVPLIVLWISLGLLAPQMYALSRISRELLLIMDNLITSSGGILAITKLLFIWNNRTHIRPMIDCMREDWDEARKWSWELDLMVKQAARARTFTICGYTMMILSFTGFVMTPFLGINIRIINNITDPYGTKRFFPLQTAYPFDAFKSPYFESIYLTQIISSAFAGFSITFPDFFFGALAFHASAQFEILAEKFKILFPKDFQTTEKCMPDAESTCWEQLRQAILRHVHLLRFAASLESLFNLLILSHVIILYVIICSLGFGVIMNIRNNFESTSYVQVVTFGGTSLDLMMHMLLYCLASEVLVHHIIRTEWMKTLTPPLGYHLCFKNVQSSGLHDAVYGSGWYLSPAKYSQNLILVMMRAKIPLQLTVGKFFNLSLGSYCTITKTAAGYISVLLAASS